MPSRADRRRLAERALRVAALAIVAALLARAVRPPAPPATAIIGPAELDARLAAWTEAPAPDTLGVALTGTPSPVRRDWLAALAHSGSVVRWSPAPGAPPLAPIALAAASTVDPRGGTLVRLAAPAGAIVGVLDDAGLIDSVRVGDSASGGTLLTGDVTGAVRAGAPGVVASVTPTPAPLRRRVMLLGRAGWEAKFIAAALEERGWTVRASLTVAPRVTVETGGDPGAGPTLSPVRARPDTGTTAVVIVLDASAAPVAAAVARYVRSGGGLVLAGEATSVPAFADLAAGPAEVRQAGIAGAIASVAPRRGLALRPIAVRGSRGASVELERRDTLVAVAARRIGAGRVVQVGYDDSWRWRLGGGEDAVARHREWWSQLVALAAYAPRSAARAPRGAPEMDAAPVAHLVDVLGPATSLGAPASAARDWFRWPLFAIVLALLLLEWGSRRARGER
jgi:hypothetical protein